MIDQLGAYQMIRFRNWRERLFFNCLTRFLRALRFSKYDSNQASMWFVILLRGINYSGPTEWIATDEFLGPIAQLSVSDD